MKICPHCDCENKKSECFCTNCGRPVQYLKHQTVAISDPELRERLLNCIRYPDPNLKFRGLGDLGKL